MRPNLNAWRGCALGAAGVVLFSLLSTDAFAQSAAEVDRLQKQLVEMQKRFEDSQRKQQKEIDALKQQIQTLNASAESAPTPTVTQPAVAESPPPSLGDAITVARAGASYMNISFGSLMDFGYSTERKPAEKLELGDHDPVKRGFSLRNAEIALDGAVDPYLKGFANIVLKLDENDNTEIELEESYLQTTALPGNLQLKAGQFFANFGRQNSQHPHQWAFVDQPIILARAFGPEGLRNIGTQISWLVPTPFYSEAFLGILDSQGDTAFNFRNSGETDEMGIARLHGRATDLHELRGPGDLLFVPRLASSFDLTDTQTIVTGVSGAFGPNSTGTGEHTQIYGADLYWKWKPEDAAAGFPFVSFQTEGVYSRFEAGDDAEAPIPLIAETLKDYGFYSQLLWGFTQGWVAGFRGEYANGNSGEFDALDPFRGERYRLSPVLTFYPSEFAKIRLQYNFDEGENFSDASSVWMQFEFDLGSHGAHKF